MFVKLQFNSIARSWTAICFLKPLSSSNLDDSNFDEAGKHIAVLSVNLSPKACYTAVKSRTAHQAKARWNTTCYP
jgi:hypothetical protein